MELISLVKEVQKAIEKDECYPTALRKEISEFNFCGNERLITEVQRQGFFRAFLPPDNGGKNSIFYKVKLFHNF